MWQKTPQNTGSVAFAKRLLQKDLAVVVTPGEWISTSFNGFNPGKNYVRFAFVPTLEETRKAAERIKRRLK